MRSGSRQAGVSAEGAGELREDTGQGAAPTPCPGSPDKPSHESLPSAASAVARAVLFLLTPVQAAEPISAWEVWGRFV